MLRLISAAILAVVTALVVLGAAEAKGPVRLVIRGGDLPAPITLDHVDDGAMFAGSGIGMEPPVPFPQFIYSVDFYPDDAEAAAQPESTIYSYPAHDGLPSAFRTSYGFFKVGKDFDAMLRDLLASQQSGGGIGTAWYVASGLALGLVLVGGGFAARAVRRRATPGMGRGPAPTQS